MYHSAATGRFYAFVNSEAGEVEQWELLATSDNEEAVGIWKYSAEPDAGNAHTG